MMSTERVEICVNDNDGIALVDLYFTGESSLNFSRKLFRNIFTF